MSCSKLATNRRLGVIMTKIAELTKDMTYKFMFNKHKLRNHSAGQTVSSDVWLRNTTANFGLSPKMSAPLKIKDWKC